MGAFDFLKKLTTGWGQQKSIQFFQDQRNIVHPFSELIGFSNSQQQRSFKSFIADGYAEGTDVKPVVDKIANTAGSVKWKVMVKNAKGEVEEAKDTGLNRLMEMPNEEMTWGDLQSASIIQLLTTGNVFTEMVEGIGMGMELNLLASQGVEPITSKTDILLGWNYKIGQVERNIDIDSVIHMKYYNPTDQGFTNHLGLSPLEAGVNAYTTSNSQWKASASLLENRGAVGFISNDSDDILTEEELDDAQRAFDRRATGVDKFGKTTVTPSKMRYQAMAMSASDLKVIEMGVMTLRSICNIYGVDSSLFNDPANKTFNNRKEAEKALWSGVNIPILNKLKFQYNKTVVKAYSELEGKEYFIDYDLSDVSVLHEDADKQADRVVKLISAGVIKPNKGAELMGIEVEETEDEQITQALNGAQVTSMVEVASQVSQGFLPKTSAIEILIISFGVSRQQAEGIINSIEVRRQDNEG